MKYRMKLNRPPTRCHMNSEPQGNSQKQTRFPRTVNEGIDFCASHQVPSFLFFLGVMLGKAIVAEAPRVEERKKRKAKRKERSDHVY